jgi:hypothetical protein
MVILDIDVGYVVTLLPPYHGVEVSGVVEAQHDAGGTRGGYGADQQQQRVHHLALYLHPLVPGAYTRSLFSST